MRNSRRAKYSRSLHTPKLRLSFHPSPFAKKVILVIIALTIFIVVGVTVYSFIFTKENQIKWQLSQIATDYYENYYYQNLVEPSSDTEKVREYLEKHHEKGLQNVTLNVLLSYDNQKNAKYGNLLGENCDRNTTFVKIYPDPPYDKKSYHIEYTYSCNYE